MAFALLGNIVIGNGVWTGPNRAQESRKATLVEHKVSRGKPVVQDHGDELDSKVLEFFFDETFCEPLDELSKLEGAFHAREPLAYVGGDGAFAGVRYIIEEFSVDTLKTTPNGRVVRLKVSAKLKEVPSPSPLDVFTAIAAASATGLSSLASLAVNVRVGRTG
jgi:phage protein U